MFDDCQRIGPGPLLVVAIICILGALIGGWVSLPILREGESGARRVIAVVSVGFAALVGVRDLCFRSSPH